MNKITMQLNADHLIKQALAEDITSEDITTNAVMPDAVTGEVDLICKQDGIVAGLDVFERVARGPETENLGLAGRQHIRRGKLADTLVERGLSCPRNNGPSALDGHGPSHGEPA